MSSGMRVLILASAVGRFGEGSTGGVSRYAAAMADALDTLGVGSELLVPEGSGVPEGIPAREIPGSFQLSSATADRAEHPVPAHSVLSGMLETAWAARSEYDRIVNLNHDYLPVFSTQFFGGKLFHIPNLVSSDRATDALISRVYSTHPQSFAAISEFQRERLGLAGALVLLFGMQPSSPGQTGQDYLCWSGRITPEKGLEAAAELARRSGLRLVVAGHVENETYFGPIKAEYGNTIDYRGFLKLADLKQVISGARAMLQTQNWEEALGLATIEAVSVGTPVIAYDRGANREIVRVGVNGYVVRHGDVEAALQAVQRAGEIQRDALIADFDARFSVQAFAQRLAEWLKL